MPSFGHKKTLKHCTIAVRGEETVMGSQGRIIAAVIALLALGIPLLIVSATPVAAQGDIARMKSDYRRPPPAPVENQALVDLGRDLFFDPQISASGRTACASCHFPELGWTVKDARSLNDSGKLTSRKSQPLIGLAHAGSGPFGWDGRNRSLEAQAKSSIATGSMSMRDTPTPVKVEVIEDRLRSNSAYVAKFQAALPGAPINMDTIARALAEFERSLEPGPADFDRWVEGDEGAISEQAKRGFVLFNTKATCFVCHTGWRFTDDRFHDIGTSTTDRGRGVELKDDPLMQFAFKTPTLRSVALHAPYMHNASSATLYDAVKHYEKGGIDRPSRSPLLLPLQLTEEERHDLVAFMESLTGAVADPLKPR
jgi:cytochrome c peroxidase